MNKAVNIIGAGLAGCEAALQLAKRGYSVNLYEMRPHTTTPAHTGSALAQLVCSNSLKSSLPTTGSGLLKQELDLLDCQLLPIARQCAVAAGSALAVDREEFSSMVKDALASYPNIQIIRQQVDTLDTDTPTIVATGPLTSAKLTAELIRLSGPAHLYFFDAIAPIISTDSIDTERVFASSRYNKGDADYLNCGFSRLQYQTFVSALRTGQKHQAHEFESEFFAGIDFSFYENCTPIEELARRGWDTLRYGVLRPVGLINPRTNRRPYAVMQLRAENTPPTSYNLVGCQTMLTQSAQKQAFTLVPGLEHARFLRYGSIHRNTFMNTPQICNPDYSLKSKPNVYLAGQITGVEGYVESIASGLLTALSFAGKPVTPPAGTILAGLHSHLTTPQKQYQPKNANFGLLPPLAKIVKDKRLKKELLAERSLELLKACLSASH